MLPLALFTLCFLGADSVDALRVPLEARSFPYHQLSPSHLHRLHPRANTTIAVKGAQNTQYLANITIGECVVLLAQCQPLPQMLSPRSAVPSP